MKSPVIKFHIEGMREQIVSMITLREKELADSMRDALNKAVESYPWEETVQEVAHEAISQGIKSYFTYGPGYTAIKKAVDDTVGVVMDDAFRNGIVEGLEESG